MPMCDLALNGFVFTWLGTAQLKTIVYLEDFAFMTHVKLKLYKANLHAQMLGPQNLICSISILCWRGYEVIVIET